MNTSTQSCDPSPDMEEVWRRSLIRVTDEFTLSPVVLRVNDAIIGTLGNFSVSTGKAKAKKTFNYNAKNEMRRFSQTNCSKVGKQNATQKISRTISLSGETHRCFTR